MNDGDKSMNIVGGVLDGALEAVRIDEFVVSLHGVAFAGFRLALDVAGMFVVDRVCKSVVCGRLVFGMVLLDGDGANGGQEGEGKDHLKNHTYTHIL